MSIQKPVHIVASLWGAAYNEKDANNLYDMICRNTSRQVCFQLFSGNELPDLNPQIQKHPEPDLNVPPEHQQRMTEDELTVYRELIHTKTKSAESYN
ncbi:MAG: hypothetical protein V2I50_11980 [Desulfuromusa sp.]|jgi:hypothetical protein|nr:hypothetical protein [Desulfuromusa sp.]